jgi:hypothetical protein
MILHCCYEELRSLAAGADVVLGAAPGLACAVAAPVEAAAEIEALAARLGGDLSVATLEDQRQTRRAVATIADGLRARMEEVVREEHPGHEQAVLLYFDYAWVVRVLDRLDRLGSSMTAMIELVTGGPVTATSSRTFRFPD